MSHPSFSRNTFVYLVGGAVTAGANILLAPVYLRVLSPAEFGTWSAFNLMLQFVQPILCLGLLASMSRLAVQAQASDRARLIGSSIQLSSLFGIVAIGLTVVSLQAGAASVIGIFLPGEMVTLVVICAAFTAYPNALLGLHVADGNALGYRSLGLLAFTAQAIVLLAASAGPTMDARVAALALVVSTAFCSAFAFLKLARQADWRATVEPAKRLVAFGIPVVLYTMAGQFSDLTTRYVMSIHSDKAQFGELSAGLIYASIVAMVASAGNLAWVPLFYRHAPEWLANGVYSQFVDVSTAATALFAAFLTIFSAEMIYLYSGGMILLPPQIVAVLVMSAWMNSSVWVGLSNPLFFEQRTRTVLAIALLSMAVCVPLSFLLVPRFAIVGAVATLWLNALLMSVLAALNLRRLGFPALNYVRLVLLLFLLGGVCGPMTILIDQQEVGSGKLIEKIALLLIVAGTLSAISWRSAISVFRAIEKRK